MCFFFVISRITLRVRKLLLLIPTDPEVQDALDNFVPKESSVWSHQVHQTVSQCSTFLFLFDAFGLSTCVVRLYESCHISLLFLQLSLFFSKLSLCQFSVEDTVHPRPGFRLPFSIYGLQAAAPAQCRIHLGVPLQIFCPGHVHLQSVIQPGGMPTCQHTPH